MRHWLVFRLPTNVHEQRPIVVTEEELVEEYRAAGQFVLGPFDLVARKGEILSA